MLNVAALTAGFNVPSSRFRVRQYIPALQNLGIDIAEFVSQLGAYPPRNKTSRPLWATGTLIERLPSIISSYRYDVTLLQREMLSTFVTLEPFTKSPRVLDVDDAIWLRRGGIFAKDLAKLCDHVICGNTFLADKFSQWNPNVSILPTAIDTDRYKPLASPIVSEKQIIGWSGTSGNLKYVHGIEQALVNVLNKYPSAKLRIVASQPPSFQNIQSERVEFVKWSPENEVKVLQEMTVGIMPLDDSLWSRGKCSFKMLTYMACGVPVVVSPVGMNLEVLNFGNIGLGAAKTENWINTLDYILGNPDEAVAMGQIGRKVVLENFSIHALAPLFAQRLKLTGCRNSS